MRRLALAVAPLSLIGCSALVESIAEPGLDQFRSSYSLVETVRETSMEVLAATPDEEPCRAEWRRLAADATDTMQRANAIYENEVNRAAPYGLSAMVDAQFRAARYLRDRIAPALDATVGCVQRGGLTMEEWIELEAAGRRPDPDEIDPAQRDAVERIGRPVA